MGKDYWNEDNNCKRYNCQNVNDAKIDGRSICEECLDELKEIKKDWPERISRLEFNAKINEFFETNKNNRLLDRDEEFNRILKHE